MKEKLLFMALIATGTLIGDFLYEKGKVLVNYAIKKQ
jgi:hypothetical protein